MRSSKKLYKQLLSSSQTLHIIVYSYLTLKRAGIIIRSTRYCNITNEVLGRLVSDKMTLNIFLPLSCHRNRSSAWNQILRTSVLHWWIKRKQHMLGLFTTLPCVLFNIALSEMLLSHCIINFVFWNNTQFFA